MNSNNTPNLSAALVDVRKAFRLLHGYHQRMFDTAKLIASRLDGFDWRELVFHAKPPNWKPTDKSIDCWNTLPGMSVAFLFERNSDSESKYIKAGDMLFTALFFADETYADTDNDDPSSWNQSAEASKSTLTFNLRRANSDISGMTWKKSWDNYDLPESNSVAEVSSDGLLLMFQKEINIEALATKDDVVRELKSFMESARAIY